MHAFLLSLMFVFIAEMGDKTQLVALALATRYRPWTVIGAIFVATAVIHLFSVILGEAAGTMLPITALNLLAGICFVFFGLWTLKGDELDEAEQHARARFGPFMSIALTFFLSELGDKTMFATITIAAQQHQFLPVWLGSTIGMVVADGLAIWLGSYVGKQLPEKFIKYAAASIFLGFGAFTMVGTLLPHDRLGHANTSTTPGFAFQQRGAL